MPRVADLAKRNNGYVSAAHVTAAGLPRRLLTAAVEAGELVQHGRGMYALPEVWEDELFLTQQRFARGIFSDETALFLHGLSDRAPEAITMTFPRSYNASAARGEGIICRSCATPVLALGVSDAKTQFGNPVRAYDAERTLCDVVRGHKVVDAQLVSPAMQRYVSWRSCDPVKLMDYARQLGVEKKIRPYLEILL